MARSWLSYLCALWSEAIASKEELLSVLEGESQEFNREIEKLHELYQSGMIDKQGFGSRYYPWAERLWQLGDELPALQAELDVLRINQLSEEEVFRGASHLASRWLGSLSRASAALWRCCGAYCRRQKMRSTSTSMGHRRPCVEHPIRLQEQVPPPHLLFKPGQKGNASMLVRVLAARSRLLGRVCSRPSDEVFVGHLTRRHSDDNGEHFAVADHEFVAV